MFYSGQSVKLTIILIWLQLDEIFKTEKYTKCSHFPACLRAGNWKFGGKSWLPGEVFVHDIFLLDLLCTMDILKAVNFAIICSFYILIEIFGIKYKNLQSFPFSMWRFWWKLGYLKRKSANSAHYHNNHKTEKTFQNLTFLSCEKLIENEHKGSSHVDRWQSS